MTQPNQTMKIPLAEQPAFPQSYLREYYDDGRERTALLTSDGMTYRQWLAGLAMQGHCASSPPEDHTAEAIARWSVQTADALIAELKKPVDQPPFKKPLLIRTQEALTEISANLYTDQDRSRCRELAANALIEIQREIGEATIS